MAPAEDGPEPRAAQVDDPPPFVKGVKGRKDMHVPKAVWRQHRPRKPRAADHVEGTGSKGGPTSARVINGVLRSLEELAIACPRNLKRWGLASEDEYFEHVRRRDVAKAALDQLLRDPSVSADDKHDAAASFSMNHGPAAFNCRRCWLLRGCCVCRMLVSLPVQALGPHRIAVYLHHHEFGRGSSTGALVSACLGGDAYVAGLRRDEEALRELCEREDGRVAVLWPGRGAVGVGDLPGIVVGGGEKKGRDGDEKGGDGDDEKGGDGGGRGWTFIAIDGTWKNARNMLKRLPKDRVVLVSLPPEAFRFVREANAGITGGTGDGASLLAPVRKYAGAPEGRTSTFEACVALLRALGVDEATCKAQLENVKTKVDAVKVQKSMAPVYEKVTGEGDFET
ncbi:predicted protein [Micromonas commoda]|uniref:tRNA-uridine aminocarboxypropyltransferase n=1 Tax=Micromonas commoda (strain RCC299 / NOUM17 / CCMP2709) TaxID=296587 RepID=C1EDT4_MICCC|nr:predicted protein [Micromonas commoda]ACO66111.1 predicted protein [Micromonas commoda]|eukprot:XP_002504853.1 predicted protein [Micromonas commoda]